MVVGGGGSRKKSICTCIREKLKQGGGSSVHVNFDFN